MNPTGDVIRKIQMDIEWDRLSFEEIAQKWDVSVEAVKDAYHQLLRFHEDRDWGFIEDWGWGKHW